MLGIIIQARLGSTRLPQKVILPFFEEKGILEILLDRLSYSRINLPIVVATTDKPIDDKIDCIAKSKGVKLFRGSENDVLNRFILAAEKFNIDKIIRICADNPFLDITAIKNLIDNIKFNEVEYAAFKTIDGTPSIKTHYGFWAEAVTLAALKKVDIYTKNEIYHEHVTNYIYSNENLFNIKWCILDQMFLQKNIRLTLDTREDFILLKSIYTEFVQKGLSIDAKSIIKYVLERKEIVAEMEKNIKENEK